MFEKHRGDGKIFGNNITSILIFGVGRNEEKIKRYKWEAETRSVREAFEVGVKFFQRDKDLYRTKKEQS